jgi:hypothetical protein
LIRLVRALAWLRWRCALNGLRRRRRGGASGRWSALLHLAGVALIAVLVAMLAGGLGLLGFVGGQACATDPARVGLVGLVSRLLLLGVAAMTLLSPFLRSGEGQAPTRLLLLPIARRSLHAATVLAGLSEPLVLVTLPALLLLPAGMASRGALMPAGLALVAGLLVATNLVALDALVGFLAQLLLRNRRRGEAVRVAALMTISLAGLLPALVSSRWEPRSAAGDEPRAALTATLVEERLGPLDALPPGLHARVLARAVAGRPGAAGILLLSLGAEGALLLAASAAAQARLLASPATGSRRARRARASRRLPRWLTGPAQTEALATLLVVLRSVRGKIAIWTPFLVLGAITLVLHGFMEREPGAAFLGAATSANLLFWGYGLCMLNLQPVAANLFATDQAGLTLSLLVPLPARSLVLGKVLGLGGLLALSMLPTLAVALGLGRPASAAAWATVGLSAIAAWLLHAPACVLISALLPRPADLAKVSGQQPHALAAIAAALVTIGSLALPRLLALLARLMGGDTAAPLGALAGLLVAVIASAGLVRFGAAVVTSRHEALASAASGR